MISALTPKKCSSAFVAILLIAIAVGQTATDRVGRITAALKNNEFDQALQLLEPTLRELPNSPQLWMLQGLAYSGKGDQKSALASFQKALKISPDYLPALEGASQLEYDAGSAEAVPLLQRVLRLQPNDPTTHAMLAVLAYKKGDCAGAVQHFAQSGPLIDSQPGALQEYGVCLIRLKEPEKAISVFQRILSSHPDDPRARRGLAAVELSVGRPQDALATLQPLLAANDPDVPTIRLAAAAYEANNDTPAAVKLLHDAIVKDPRNVALYVDFANIAMTHQSFQTGIEMIDAGLKGKPKAAELYLARGCSTFNLPTTTKRKLTFEVPNSWIRIRLSVRRRRAWSRKNEIRMILTELLSQCDRNWRSSPATHFSGTCRPQFSPRGHRPQEARNSSRQCDPQIKLLLCNPPLLPRTMFWQSFICRLGRRRLPPKSAVWRCSTIQRTRPLCTT